MASKIAPHLTALMDDILRSRGLSYSDAPQAQRDLQALLAVVDAAERAKDYCVDPPTYRALCFALKRLRSRAKGGGK